MNATVRMRHPAFRFRPVLPFYAVCTAVSAASLASLNATVPEPKTHTLFMGADIDIKVSNDFCRVRDVNGDAFVVDASGSAVFVPMNRGQLNLKIQQSLKLAEASATVVDLNGERIYTDANDPRKRFSRQQPVLTETAAFDSAAGAALTASLTLGPYVQAGVDAPAGLSGQAAREAGAAASAQISAIRSDASNAAGDQSSEANNIGNYIGKMQAELDKELFDALEVDFRVSSEKPLSQPYAVIIARYHEKETNPPKHKYWVFAKALPPVDRHPQTVRVVQGGFPPGFVLDDFKVHLFDRGRELATNLADKRVELTFGDAFKYVLLDYVSAHKGASLPAAPVMRRLPDGWQSRLTADQLAKPCFVKVSTDGMPLGTFEDEACSRPVADPALAAVVGEIRFTPALDRGRPMAGTARLRLGDIRL